MPFDKELLLGLGITEAVANRYEKHAAKKPVKNSKRFNLHGPIVSDLTAEIYRFENAATPKALREFLEANEGNDIEININSPGGSVWDATSMFGELMRHKGKVTVMVGGACLSAATHFLALPNAERVAVPGSEFMIHNPWTLVIGEAKDLRKQADSLDKTAENIAARLAKAMGAEVSKVRSMMDEETWFTDDEALDASLVDTVLQAKESKDESEEPDEDESEMKERKERADKAQANRLGYQRRQAKRNRSHA